MSSPDSPSRRAFAAGRFRDAERLIAGELAKNASDRALAVEVAFYRGSRSVRDAALAIIEDDAASPVEKSRCAVIVAYELREHGSVEQSLDWYRRALSFANESGDAIQRCKASRLLLERVSDRTAFDGSLPLAREVRRLALQAGDAQVLAETHVTFAGLEARVGNFEAAHRHMALARTHLADSPNLLIEATAALDEAAIWGTEGDPASALGLGLTGMDLANRSGWLRGMIVGTLNCAHLYLALGDTQKADEYIQQALRHGGRGRNYDSALAETRLQLAIALGKVDEVQTLLAETSKTELGLLDSWYEVSVLESLIQVQAQGTPLARRYHERGSSVDRRSEEWCGTVRDSS